MSRGKSVSKGGACTRCGKHHPPGKKRRARLKAKGLWGGCNPNQKAAAKTSSNATNSQRKIDDPEKRAAKNATCKERNEARRKIRQYEAKARNSQWQSLTLEQQLEACKKSPFNKQKQINKIKARIAERDKQDDSGNNSGKLVDANNRKSRRKRRNRPSR